MRKTSFCLSGIIFLFRILSNVDLPDPLDPIIPIREPGYIIAEKSSKDVLCGNDSEIEFILICDMIFLYKLNEVKQIYKETLFMNIIIIY